MLPILLSNNVTNHYTFARIAVGYEGNIHNGADSKNSCLQHWAEKITDRNGNIIGIIDPYNGKNISFGLSNSQIFLENYTRIYLTNDWAGNGVFTQMSMGIIHLSIGILTILIR